MSNNLVVKVRGRRQWDVSVVFGFIQSELAKKIGIKQSNISRFESGDYNPSIEFLYKVATGLNKTINIQLVNK